MSTLIPVLSLVVSAIALGVAIWAHVRGHRFGKRMVALEEARESDRIRQGAKANLVADIQRGDGSGPVWRLEVENRGQAEARDVTVLLDAQPILDHPGVARATQQGLNRELRHLAAGARFRYVLAPTLGCRPPWELEITWTDDSGEPGSYQATLTF